IFPGCQFFTQKDLFTVNIYGRIFEMPVSIDTGHHPQLSHLHHLIVFNKLQVGDTVSMIAGASTLRALQRFDSYSDSAIAHSVDMDIESAAKDLFKSLRQLDRIPQELPAIRFAVFLHTVRLLQERAQSFDRPVKEKLGCSRSDTAPG